MGRFLRGHLGRCKWSVAWRDVADVYLAKRPTLVILETVGAGARKSVCFCDLLRWSVVRQGSSDLDGLTLATREGRGNQPSCSLPFEANRPNVEMMCLDPEAAAHSAGWMDGLIPDGLRRRLRLRSLLLFESFQHLSDRPNRSQIQLVRRPCLA